MTWRRRCQKFKYQSYIYRLICRSADLWLSLSFSHSQTFEFIHFGVSRARQGRAGKQTTILSFNVIRGEAAWGKKERKREREKIINFWKLYSHQFKRFLLLFSSFRVKIVTQKEARKNVWSLNKINFIVDSKWSKRHLRTSAEK